MSALNWRIQHFDVVDSTNDWLRGQARSGQREGLVAVADFQSSGRGRLDRTWEAPAGTSLLCSILLRPAISNDDLQLVVAAVALSTRAALKNLCGLEADLKWPNDLLVRERKIAGVLAEVVWHDGVASVVVGIGVNLTYAGPPGAHATSVQHETGVTLSPAGLLDEVLVELAGRRALLDDPPGRTELRDEYVANLSTIGRRVRIEQSDRVVLGDARGVDETGRLVVDVDGDTMVFAAGDVVHVRGDGEGGL